MKQRTHQTGREAPTQWAHHETSNLELPSEVVLTRSGRASLDMPNLELFVPLRPNRAAQRRPKTALCTNGVYDYQGLEQVIPGHVEFWFRYHSDYLGIDEIYVYDLDGSFKDLSIIRELQERGKLFYERFIPSIPPLEDVFDQAGYKVSTTHFTQTSVHQHCWQRARQNADWALSLAGSDISSERSFVLWTDLESST